MNETKFTKGPSSPARAYGLLLASAQELYENLANADVQMEMAGDCIEAGRYDEALLHVRSMVRLRRNALAKARGEAHDP